MTSFRLHTGDDLRRISRGLRGVDNREIKKRFTRELRAAAKPMVPAVRRSIRNIPSSRPYRGAGLRGRLARAVKLEIRTSGRKAGITIRVDGRKMPSGQKALPALVEGSKPRWRHPVFGNRSAWVTQDPSPYFRPALRSLGPRSRVAVNRVIDGISRDIT